MPTAKLGGPIWRRDRAPAPGMPATAAAPGPMVWCSPPMAAGFFGSDEATATLETLKQYLKLSNVDIIGRFSCAGKETGPAGYPVGVKPKADFRPGMAKDGPDADVCDAVLYRMGDGSLKPGSYFFHYDCDSKPGPGSEAKARAFMADIVEDYFFMTYDGVPNPPLSRGVGAELEGNTVVLISGPEGNKNQGAAQAAPWFFFERRITCGGGAGSYPELQQPGTFGVFCKG